MTDTNLRANSVEELAELDEVLNDLRDVWEHDVTGDDDRGTTQATYPRTVTIEFPPICSRYPGVQSLTVSIRDLLSWYAQHASTGDRSTLEQIRDLFYGGDDDEDYETGLARTDGMVSPEERAIARWELERGKVERIRKMAKLETEGLECITENERFWAPVLAEKLQLDAWQETLFARAEALDQEWFEFVARMENGTSTPEECVSRRRTELQAKTDQLIAENESWQQQYDQLYHRACEHFDREELDA